MANHGIHWRFGGDSCNASEARGKRRANKTWNLEFLLAEAIPYKELNGDNHLMIEHAGYTVEFWPGSGTYRFRFGGQYGILPDCIIMNGHGVKKLVLQLRKAQEYPR